MEAGILESEIFLAGPLINPSKVETGDETILYKKLDNPNLVMRKKENVTLEYPTPWVMWTVEKGTFCRTELASIYIYIYSFSVLFAASFVGNIKLGPKSLDCPEDASVLAEFFMWKESSLWTHFFYVSQTMFYQGTVSLRQAHENSGFGVFCGILLPSMHVGESKEKKGNISIMGKYEFWPFFRQTSPRAPRG